MDIVNDIQPVKTLRANCFYQALFPAFCYYGKDFSSLIINSFYTFRYDDVTHRLTLEMHKCLPDDILFKSSGIQLMKKKIDSDFIEIICNFLADGKLVIVPVDMFELPNSNSTFQKIHSKHGVLVYGYNLERKVFYILDHDYINDYHYIKQCIGFDNLNNAYVSFIRQYHNTDGIDVIEGFNEKNSRLAEKFLALYQKKVLQSTILTDSIKNLKDYANIMNNHCGDEHLMLSLSGYGYNAFNGIINQRHLEYYYANEYLIEKAEICKKVEKIIESYNYIRAIMYKTNITKIIREKTYINCCKTLDIVIQLESEYCKLMLNYMVPENLRANI